MEDNIHTLKLNLILLGLVQGKYNWVIDYPGYGNINVKILQINFENIFHRPIKVKILDKGLLVDKTEFEQHPFVDDEEIRVVVKRPFLEDWVNVEYFKVD